MVWVSQTDAQSPPSAPPTVRSITIRGNTRTRSAVIRRELLFSEGEPLDSNLVAETARNLRLLPFLGRAEIRVLKADGSADVVVEAQDLYARALSPLISGGAGEYSYGFVALDYNLLGLGQTAQITVERDALSGHFVEAHYSAPSQGDQEAPNA